MFNLKNDNLGDIQSQVNLTNKSGVEFNSEEHQILDAIVYHRRHTPVDYKFSHKVIFIMVQLDKINLLSKIKLFSLNKFNMFSLCWDDYGFEKIIDPKESILKILDKFNLSRLQVSKVVLFTMPKVLGYIFNPVSFWLCFDHEQQLYAVLAEVNNTFGERHGYLCYHNHKSSIVATDYIYRTKVFHVSPFCEITGHYQFKFNLAGERIEIAVDYYDGSKPIITTSIVGVIKQFNDLNLLKYFLLYPFMTLKVIILIHYHALRLWLKKVPICKNLNKDNKDIS